MTRYGIDPVDEALYDTAHEFFDGKTGERGVKPLARRLGRNAGTLQNQVNPNCETHRLGIHDAIALMLSADDFRGLYQINAACHHACYPLVDLELVETDELLHAVLKFSRESGEVSQAIDQALRDDRITAHEFVGIAGEIDDVLRAILELRSRLLGKVEDPNHLPESLRESEPDA